MPGGSPPGGEFHRSELGNFSDRRHSWRSGRLAWTVAVPPLIVTAPLVVFSLTGGERRRLFPFSAPLQRQSRQVCSFRSPQYRRLLGRRELPTHRPLR